MDTAARVRREVATLRAVHDAGLPAPEPIAADADGRESDGLPALLMTRLPGRLDVTRADPEGWLRQIAVMAVRIHDAQVAAGPFEERIDAAAPVIPASATRPAVSEAAFGILRQQPPEPATCFIHRDFQHFNLLWQRGRRTGVVDWTRSCTGPADFDVGHCRLNLAVLFGADWAQRFRLDYEADAGRAIDPWWTCTRLPPTAMSGAGSSQSRWPARSRRYRGHDIPLRRSTGSDIRPALRCRSVAGAPLWWTDGVGQAVPGHLRLRRT